MLYQFDDRIAAQYGVSEAIFVHRVYWWVRQNRANGRNFRDGRYWTHDSIKALISPDIFGFWTRRQMERIVKSCCDKGLILTADYNTDRRARPLWYTVTDKVLAIYEGDQPAAEDPAEAPEDSAPDSTPPNGGVDSTKRGNALHQMVESTPPNGGLYYKEQLEDNSYKTRESARARADAPADGVTITAPAEAVTVVCGELSNVLLSQDQLDKLLERWPRKIVEQEIEALSCYMASKGKKYKSHYATLLNWLRRDYPDGPPKERGNQIEDEEWIKA